MAHLTFEKPLVLLETGEYGDWLKFMLEAFKLQQLVHLARLLSNPPLYLGKVSTSPCYPSKHDGVHMAT
jgi:hypothetical protein